MFVGKVAEEHASAVAVDVVRHPLLVAVLDSMTIVVIAVVQPIEDWKDMRYSSVDRMNLFAIVVVVAIEY